MRNTNFKIFLILIVFMSTSFSSVSAQEDKVLYFDDKNGELYYEIDGQIDNQFIVNENISSGIPYEDTLKVVNQSKYDYDLFLSMLPDAITNKSEKSFLQSIMMNVYFNEKLVYEGDALGATKISLGKVKAHEKYPLVVETKLIMNTVTVQEEGYYVKSAYADYKDGGSKPIAYATQELAKEAALLHGEQEIVYASLGYLTNDERDDFSKMIADTNWQFYAQRDEATKPTEIKPGPDTGYMQPYIYVTLFGLLLTSGYFIHRKVRKLK